MSRMTKERRADLEKMADEDPHMCLLRELLNEIDAQEAEVAALRRQVEERSDVVPPPGFEVSEYAAIHHIGMLHGLPKICKRGPGAWAAFVDDYSCIGKDGNVYYELRPSSRTLEFVALTRFATPHAAARALRSGDAGKERGAA